MEGSEFNGRVVQHNNTFYAPHVGCPEPERVAFWHRLFASIQAVTHALPDVPVALAGDSNVWFPGLVQNRPTRPQDRACIEQIRLILDTFGLQICNPLNAPTHRRGAALDLVFATPNTAMSVDVHNGDHCSCAARSACCPLLGSDHFALTVSIKQSMSVPNSCHLKPPAVRDWKTLLESQRQSIQIWVEELHCAAQHASGNLSQPNARALLDDAYANLLQIIWGGHPSLHRPICVDRPKRQPAWWGDACMSALLTRNAAWRERRCNPTPATDAIFKAARNKFHRIVCKSKRSFWAKWTENVENLASTCPREAARMVRRSFRRNSARVASSLCPDPHATIDQQQQCLNERRAHFQQAGAQGAESFDARHFARVRRRVERIRCECVARVPSDHPFTAEELQHALKLCASRKTPGADSIPYEAFCVDLPWWKETVLNFVELCRSLSCVPFMWKHGTVIPLAKGIPSNNRDNYRPITLTCCFAKILERMILNRIHPIVDPILDDCQAGFRWGSDLQAYSLLETLSMRRHTRTYCAFVDIRKAFDVAWKDGAMLRLHRAGVQNGLRHLIDDMVSDRTATVQVSSLASCAWDVENGIGQGSVLSGFLFNVLINGLATDIKRACNGVTCPGIIVQRPCL